MVFAGLSMATLMLIVMAIVVALYVFIFSPLEVGAQRFFVRNLNQRAEVKELAFGYDNNYKEVVKTIFLRWLFVFLWGLLLIIPGIYKSYEYRMIPYLLAEDPTMTKDRAFAESKRMMYGHKWNTFVLDLSFLGWNILSFFTLGILGVFYVAPYQAQTNAALYEKLRYGLPAPTPNAQATPYAGAPVPLDAQNAPYTGAQTPYAGSYSAPVSSATPAAYDAPAASAAYSAPAAVVPAPAAPPAYSAPEMVAPEPVPNANDQVQAVPVIVSESQPPIPPFAQVGGEIEDDVDPTAELFESDAEPMVEPSEDDVEPTATIPEINSATTAALPEVGIDPTKQFPAAAENDEASDSPEA
jgi:hypothetical protein